MMNRKHFMLTAAAASQAVFAQGDQVATAVIGVGNRGSSLMHEVMQQSNARLVAICDIKPDRLDKAASAASKFNPTTTNDWHKILADKNIDAVYIATPPYLHVEMAIAALQAGKHVYCEKPIGTTPAAIRDLVRVARGSKKVFQAGQQLRSYTQLAEAIRLIHDGAIGDVLFVKAQRHASADLSHEGSSADWYFNKAKSGGYLVEQSVHNLDACNWAIGQHPTRAAGFGGTKMYANIPPGRDIMDHQSITYDYANGVQLSFTQLVFHPRGMPGANQIINVYGTKGAVELMNSAQFYSLDGKEQRLLTPKVEQKDDAHTTAFFSAILTGSKVPADINVGAAGALTAIMGNQVCELGRVVNWSEFDVQV